MTVKNADIHGLNSRVRKVVEEFKTLFPDFDVVSGYRSPAYNKGVKGAKGSQHTHGNAFDFNPRGDVSPERKADAVNWVRSQGAMGLGTYDKTGRSFHADWRTGGPAMWGPNRSRSSLDRTPDWFQTISQDHFAGRPAPTQFATIPPGSIPNVEPRVAAAPAPVAAAPAPLPARPAGARPLPVRVAATPVPEDLPTIGDGTNPYAGREIPGRVRVASADPSFAPQNVPLPPPRPAGALPMPERTPMPERAPGFEEIKLAPNAPGFQPIRVAQRDPLTTGSIQSPFAPATPGAATPTPDANGVVPRDQLPKDSMGNPIVPQGYLPRGGDSGTVIPAWLDRMIPHPMDRFHYPDAQPAAPAPTPAPAPAPAATPALPERPAGALPMPTPAPTPPAPSPEPDSAPLVVRGIRPKNPPPMDVPLPPQRPPNSDLYASPAPLPPRPAGVLPQPQPQPQPSGSTPTIWGANWHGPDSGWVNRAQAPAGQPYPEVWTGPSPYPNEGNILKILGLI